MKRPVLAKNLRQYERFIRRYRLNKPMYPYVNHEIQVRGYSVGQEFITLSEWDFNISRDGFDYVLYKYKLVQVNQL